MDTQKRSQWEIFQWNQFPLASAASAELNHFVGTLLIPLPFQQESLQPFHLDVCRFMLIIHDRIEKSEQRSGRETFSLGGNETFWNVSLGEKFQDFASRPALR